MITKAFCYHKDSYTSNYAIKFQQSWNNYMDAEQIQGIDLCSPLLDKKIKVTVTNSDNNELTINSKGFEIIYAFHPKAHLKSDTDDSLSTSIRLLYANSLIAAGCPNPPIFGFWGLHITHSQALLAMKKVGLNIWPITESTSNKDLAFDPQEIFLLDKWLYNSEKKNTRPISFTNLKKRISKYGLLQVIGPNLIEIQGSTIKISKLEKKHPLLKLLDFWGTQALELVFFKKNQTNLFVGVHPCLTHFPKQTIKAIDSLQGKL